MRRAGGLVSLLVRLTRYTVKRFPPSHVVYAALLTAATLAVTGTRVVTARSAVALAAALVMLLSLRVLDDLKDEETDRISHPDRPLPAGEVSRSLLFCFVAVMVLPATVLAAVVGSPWLAAVLIFIAYAFLMFRSFFTRRKIERLIPLFVFSHTLIALPIVVVLASIATGFSISELPRATFFLGCLAWSSSLTFDFARKLMMPGEAGYDGSYSSSIGAGRTSALAVASISASVGFALALGLSAGFGSGYHITVSASYAGAFATGLYSSLSGRGVRLFRSLAASTNIVPNMIIIGAALWQ